MVFHTNHVHTRGREGERDTYSLFSSKWYAKVTNFLLSFSVCVVSERERERKRDGARRWKKRMNKYRLLLLRFFFSSFVLHTFIHVKSIESVEDKRCLNTIKHLLFDYQLHIVVVVIVVFVLIFFNSSISIDGGSLSPSSSIRFMKNFFFSRFCMFFFVSHFICFKLNDSCFLLVTKRKRQLCVCVYTCVDREERISYFNCAWRDDTTHFVARRWSLSFSLSLLF